ncbi:MAG: ribulose-phosphate 3-epimerase [Kiritimatiellae bacterium]|nr:ribulose-phosphate 3-epimerase [Kiritimatiellia bacterium]
MLEIQIMPSILAADIGRLEEACKHAERSGADALHIDVMDGHFVPNISLGPEVVRMARESVNIPLSVHLMITQPDRYAETFIEAGADTVLIHIEASCNVEEILHNIRKAGARPGITINPETSVTMIEDILQQQLADEVLFMTVHPGFGGQRFIESVLSKINAIREKYPELDLSVDGGLNLETAVQSARHGANIFMVGTTLFKATDMTSEIAQMRKQTLVAFQPFSLSSK